MIPSHLFLTDNYLLYWSSILYNILVSFKTPSIGFLQLTLPTSKVSCWKFKYDLDSVGYYIRAGHFLTKFKKSTGTVWISFTNTSSSTKKKELCHIMTFMTVIKCHKIWQHGYQMNHLEKTFWCMKKKMIFDPILLTKIQKN